MGKSSSGKTSLATRFVNNTFDENSPHTIGAAFYQKVVGDTKASIWDTAGQEKFRALTSLYYRDASAAILVFDLTEKGALDQVKSDLDALEKYCSDNICRIIVGNKLDLVEGRQVAIEEAQALADASNSAYVETSAKDGTNVERAFTAVI